MATEKVLLTSIEAWEIHFAVDPSRSTRSVWWRSVIGACESAVSKPK